MSGTTRGGACARMALAGLALALLPLAAAGPTRADDAEASPLRYAATATIELQESYAASRTLDRRGRPVEVPGALPTVALPYRSVIAALLGHAGVEVLSAGAATADLRVAVTSRGTTHGQLYDAAVSGQRIRELRYTDAVLTGELRLVSNATVMARSFAGEVRPDVHIIGVVHGGDHRRDPNYAPFRQAFEAPDGFLDVLGAVVLEIWGDEPLLAAAGDRDPLVRAAAARAMEALPE